MRLSHLITALAVPGLIAGSVSSTEAANIALGKAVTASGFLKSNFESPLVVDGPPSNGSDWLAPAGATGDYVTVNLGARYDVSDVTLYNTRNFDNSSGDRGTDAYTLLMSANGDSFTQVATGNMPTDETTSETPTFANQTAQFVRFRVDSILPDTIDGNTINKKGAGLMEMQVDGTVSGVGVADAGRDAALPINGTPGTGVNIAAGKSASASGNFSGSFGGADAVTDGDTSSNPGSWALPDGDTGYVEVDLGDTHNLAGVELVNATNNGSGDTFTYDFRLQLSTDGNNYTTALDGVLPQRRDDGWQFLLDGQSARYVRFHADSFLGNGKRAGLAEMRVFEAIPEPTSLAMLGLGGLALLPRRRRLA